MIIVAGTVRFDPSIAEPLLEAWDACREQVLAEDGCLEYDVHRSRHDAGEVLLFERWTTMAALEAHLAGEPVARWRARLAELGEVAADYTIYEAEAVG